MANTSSFNVTRFSFVGGRAKPVEQTLVLEGVNKYDSRHVVFAANVEGKEKPAHLFNLNIEDIKAFVEVLKAAITEAKEAPDTTPAEYRARQAKKAASLPSKPEAAPVAPQIDLQAMITMMQAAGFKIEAPTPQPVATPKTIKAAVKRGAVQTKPAEVLKPSDIPTLDDLEDISTPELEAVQNIMAILLSKRGKN